MTENVFEYWRPGDEERRLRIFISHRFDKDQELYDSAIDALNSNGFAVQDMSLSSERAVSGPQGGRVPRLRIRAEVAARIYTSDVVITPSRPAVTRSEWVTWEVELAAVGYGVPILFVNQKGQQLHAQLVAQINALGLPHHVCDPTIPEIVQGVIGLVDGRPKWAMRQEETEPALAFRGPPTAARNEVLKRYPFQPRLTPFDLDPPRPKRKLWPF